MDTLTIPRMVFQRVARKGDALGFRYRRNGIWQDLTWTQYGRAIKEVALALDGLGLKPGDRSAILCNTRIEWHFADLGTLSLGALAVGIYPTLLPEDVAYILKDSGSRVLFVEDWHQLEKVRSIWDECKDLEYVIAIDADGIETSDRVLTMEALLEMGGRVMATDPERFGRLLERGRAEDLFTVVYTSGTTGPPKGAMLTHANALEICRSVMERNLISDHDVVVEYLPLAHAYERVGGLVLGLYAGGLMGIAESFDTLREDIVCIKPTVMLGVPRVYEKIYDGILAQVRQSGGARQRLFDWAVRVGRESTPYRTKGLPMPFALKVQYDLANRLVFSRLKEILGGNMRFMFSAAAPLAAEIVEFFYSLGILILQGYGMTECCAPATMTSLEEPALGTVGKALSCNEVVVAPDGEILIRGSNVFRGYWNKPVATAEALDAKGWLHSGDIGEYDIHGNLKITDRKKDLIITAGGKNISPQNIESRLKQDPYITEALVYGDRRPYLVALLTLEEERIRRYAMNLGIDIEDFSELVRHQEIKLLLEQSVGKANEDLARFEQIKYFEALPVQFSIESGTITPTMKLKRKEIVSRYGDVIDGLYK